MIRKSIRLKDLSNPLIYKNQSGVYILRLNGSVVKVGCARIGLQNRMQQYYNLNPWCGLNKHINSSNRDSITVDFQICSYSECAELESKLFDKYTSDAPLPWTQRRPHVDRDTIALKI